MGVLIGEIKRFRENGGDIKLANMGPEIYEIYQMLEFYHIISEYASVADALKSMNIGSSPGRVEKKTVETLRRLRRRRRLSPSAEDAGRTAASAEDAPAIQAGRAEAGTHPAD